MSENPHQYDNPLTTRYASARMSEIWSPQRKFSTWRRLWVALAEKAYAELAASGWSRGNGVGNSYAAIQLGWRPWTDLAEGVRVVLGSAEQSSGHRQAPAAPG